MADSDKKKFSWRAFISVLATLTFIASVFTGFILFITPPGRVANWTGWQMLGLSKHQWGAMHICFSAIFFITCLFHIYFNFKALAGYFKNRLTRKFSLRLEWLAAFIICGVIFAGTYHEFSPFSNLLKLNSKAKNSWSKGATKAPIPHAESLSLAELADKDGVNLQVLMENLTAAGIEVESDQVIVGDLAFANNMVPSELYAIATGKEVQLKGRGYEVQSCTGDGAGQGGGQGLHKQGLGMMTVEVYCQEEGINIDKAITSLKAAGFEAKAGARLKELAESANVKPVAIAEIIQKAK